MEGRCSATNGNAAGCESGVPLHVHYTPGVNDAGRALVLVIRVRADYLEPK